MVVHPFAGVQKLNEAKENSVRKPKAPSDTEDNLVEPIYKPKANSFRFDKSKGFMASEVSEKRDQRAIFAQSVFVKGHILEMKLYEKQAQESNRSDFLNPLILECYDLSSSKQLKGIQIPRNRVHLKDVGAQELLDILDINFKTGEIRLKNGKSQFDIKSNTNRRRIESPTDHEDIDSEPTHSVKKPAIRELMLGGSNEKKTFNDLRKGSSGSDGDTFRAIGPLINKGKKTEERESQKSNEYPVPLNFGGRSKVECMVQHDLDNNKVEIRYIYRNPEGEDYIKALSVPSEVLGVPREGFLPGEFIENMAIILRSKLVLKDGELLLKEGAKIPRDIGDSESDKGEEINEKINEEIPESNDTEIIDPLSKNTKGYGRIEIKPMLSPKEDRLSGSTKAEKRTHEEARKRRYFKNTRQSLKTTTADTPKKESEASEEELITGPIMTGSYYKENDAGNKPQEKNNRYSKEEIEEDLPDLKDKEVQEATMKIQMAYKKKKNLEAKSKEKTVEVIEKKEPEEIEEDLPDLQDEEVQAATLKIQKAYLKKKGQSKNVISKQSENIEKEEEEELPDLEDKDVQKATLTIQKAYLKKKNKPQNLNQPVNQLRNGIEEEIKIQEERIEEELPDLNDKDVQNATLAIQKAYMRKKNKSQQKDVPEIILLPQKQEQAEIEDELPDLNDKDVQDATLAIQNAYKKKKNRDKMKTEKKSISTGNEILIVEGFVNKKPFEPEEELPNLEDPEVKNATLKIQNAYLKKKNRTQNTNKPEGAQIRTENPLTGQKEEKEEEELPDLNDKDVQNATLAIQKAYLKKKKQGWPTDKTAGIKAKSEQQSKDANKQADEEEMPDINDPEVQNATLAIQKAYMKKKNRAKNAISVRKQEDLPKVTPQKDEEELPDLEDREVQQATLKIQNAYIKKKRRNQETKPKQVQPEPEKDDELPNLEDKEVQQATLKIQKAYQKRQARKEKAPQDKKSHEEAKIVQKEEKEEELPDLEDKDVQNATFAIQKAYLKKKQRDQSKKEEKLPGKKVLVKEEPEEELPDLNDKDVQNATLAIQKAYMKKKSRQTNKPEKVKPQEENEEHQNKEEEELPNLEDPEIQNATIAIQNAYKKRKENLAAAENKKPNSNVSSTPTSQDEIQSPTRTNKETQKKNTKETSSPYTRNRQKRQSMQLEVEIHLPPENPRGHMGAGEELPDIEDPEIQRATLKIQNAYKKRQEKKKDEEKDVIIEEKGNEGISFVEHGSDESPSESKEGGTGTSEQRKKEIANLKTSWRSHRSFTGEIPRIVIHMEDDSAQDIKQKMRTEPAGNQYEEIVFVDEYSRRGTPVGNQEENEIEQKQVNADEDLPDLEDPEVEKATMAIQKAYLKSKGRKNKH